MPKLKTDHTAAFINDDIEAEINTDFSIPAFLQTESLEWQPSPVAGVMRKRLELVGLHNPRLTTLVKFAPGSTFKEHGHDGGEEFFVLSGIFSDASGDYGAGSYVRNPPGTFHAPFTDEGCTILVKLRQFQSLDNKQLVVDSTAIGSKWLSTGDPGVSCLKLHHFATEKIFLYCIRPQSLMANRVYTHGLEIYLYEGSISDGENCYTQGTWIRYPAGIRTAIYSDEGARLYIKESVYPAN